MRPMYALNSCGVAILGHPLYLRIFYNAQFSEATDQGWCLKKSPSIGD